MYASPSSPAPATSLQPLPAPPSGLPRFSQRASAAAVLALMPVLASVLLWQLGAHGVDVHNLQIGALFTVCTIGSVLGLFTAITTSSSIKRAHLAAADASSTPSSTRPPRGRWLAIATIPVALIASLWGALLVFFSTVHFTRGRQLRDRTGSKVARLVPGTAWLDAALGDSPLSAPDGVAAAWRENGKTEHASVVAFAQLSGELLALGAPPALVDGAHKDGLDEMVHTRLCFTLARAIDATALEPGPLAAPTRLITGGRTLRIARLAVESLVEGALNEGASARIVAALAHTVSEPRIRGVLTAIASDEGRHARHGFDVLAWCLDEGGVVARSAVEGALRALPTSIGASLAPAADDGVFEPFGIPGRALQQRCYEEVRATVVARTRALLARSLLDHAAL